MEITEEQFNRIKSYFPIQRGNTKISNIVFINALMYMVENGCKWRCLPSIYGNWFTVYKRCERWNKSGVLKRIFEALQREQLIKVNIEIIAIDSTSIKAHPDAHGARKKGANKPLVRAAADGTQNFMWYPSMIKL